ncbi:cytochrome P450 [Suillus fuscotomentosus]|uniref:Cytochrome P450 n=1 Tax=Suillus fuscotomentosus TaxID=1912939 RepID=A0AAD4DYA5_9AGAM|nr:cytochrome P450 [Suillus fuscotomentosus]KAG1895877.1 cytochrome P450 [Suillus fuscotomentosus]
MDLPPGIVYLISCLPQLLLPPTIVYGLNRICDFAFGVSLQGWSQIPAYVLSFPALFTCSVLAANYHDRRQAAMHGAVLPPMFPSRLPGSLDLLAALVQNFKIGYMGELMEKQCNTLGHTFNMRVLFENRIFTAEPEYIKAILATKFTSFAKGPMFSDQVNSLLGTGVFNSDGDVWKFHRSMTRPFFSKDRVSHFDIFDKHAEDAISQLKIRLRDGYPVDFQDMVSRFTLDSATEFLFGQDVCSLSAGLIYPPSSPRSKDIAFENHPANKFAHAFSEAQIAAAYRGRFGSAWRLSEFWTDRVKKHMDVCYKFIDPILKEALEKNKMLKENMDEKTDAKDRDVEEGETLLDHLVNYTEDPIVIRDEILNIMIAGRDTTAATLTFVIYMLTQHPDVLHRLREEILSKVGSSRRPTYDDMRDMKYMRAVINETLRLYPPVPFNVRTSTEPAVWPGIDGGKPIYIPPNTRTPYSVFLMHRRTDLWGPDAQEFDPDRFLDDRLRKYCTPNPFIFVPFNAGPRICLGQQFAYNETSFFLVRLLQQFSSISLATDVQTLPPAEWAECSGRKAIEKVIIKSHLTIYAHNGIWVRMEEASPVEVV